MNEFAKQCSTEIVNRNPLLRLMVMDIYEILCYENIL